MCPERLRVEVAFALPERQVVIALEVEPGTTAAEAVRRSRIVEAEPRAAACVGAIGVHGREVAPDRVLDDGDRVELYRPLEVDPKTARRRRAAARRPG